MSPDAIFAFLWQCFLDGPDDTYIGYYLGYDFTQWTRHLPESRARMLWHADGVKKRQRRGEHLPPFPVRWQDWEFDILASKRFKLRRVGAKRWMYVNDTGPYFQCSFLKAIDPGSWDRPVCTQAEFDMIAAGKKQRAKSLTRKQFCAELPRIIEYNAMENRVLPRLLSRLEEGLAAEGLTLKRSQWHGPGQAAQAWMRKINVPTGEEVAAVTPREVLAAAGASYYGGWFEIFAHGHLPGSTWEYDINSAYPWAMTRLPCLVHGRWVRGYVPGARWVLQAASGVESNNRVLGGAPCRRKDGSIARPAVSSGWYWMHELDAAARATGFLSWFESERWSLTSDCNCLPYVEALPELYQRRLEVGKNSPHGKALKVIYNSVYGKTAQSVGSPRFANPIHASLITSLVRTRILDAIATHPSGVDSLVMVATDGVYFREEHTRLEVDGAGLGKWDATVRSDMCLFKPGVYWDADARARVEAGELPVLHSRGISASALAQQIHRIDEAFRARTDTGWDWPVFEIPLDFDMISARTAITQNNWSLAGTLKQNSSRIESSQPWSKRWGSWVDHRGDYRTGVHPTATPDTVSVPYDGTFGLEQEEILTPDGDPYDLISEALHN